MIALIIGFVVTFIVGVGLGYGYRGLIHREMDAAGTTVHNIEETAHNVSEDIKSKL
jgi:hypothetical protein